MTKHPPFKLTLVAAALATLFGQAARADEADDAVRAFSKPDSYATFGVGELGGHREQFGRYDGLTEKGTYGILDLSVRKRDDATGTWTNFSGRNLGLDSREFRGEYERQGSWGAALDYSETPSRDPKTYYTGTRGIGSTQLQYGTVGANAAAAQAGLYPATNETHLGTKRKNATLSGSAQLTPDLSFFASFKNEDKNGTQLWGRGSNPEFAVQPIDWTTQQLDAGLNYAGKQLQLRGGISATWFRNANSYVDTIGGSAFAAAGGHTVLSLPLDNDAFQYFLDGGYSFTPRTRATFKASFSRARQNDDLSPISDVLRAVGGTGVNGVAAFAPTRLGGRVDTTTLNFAFSTKPIDRLSIVAKYDYNERKDKTPVQTFGIDTASGDPITNNPHSFTKQSGKVEGTYRLNGGYSAIAGLENERRTRELDVGQDGAFEGTVKMRDRTDETTLRLQLRKAMAETLNGSLAYLHSRRIGSSWNNPASENLGALVAGGVAYTDVTPTTVAFTNPFAYADRKRNALRGTLDWTPTQNASLQLNLQYSEDKYDPAKSGLQDGRDLLLSLDGAVALTKDWQLNAWASHDTSRMHQIGITYDPRTTTALRDPSGAVLTTFPGSVGWVCSSANTGPGQCNFDLVWDARLKDTNNFIGIGVKGKATAKLNAGVNLQWSESTNDYPLATNVPAYNTNTGATPTNRSRVGPPDIKTTTLKLALFGQYALQKDMDLRLDFIHQRWKTNDWTWMTWNSSGTALQPFTYMDGTRVVQRQSQSSNFIGASLNFRFQ
ncbi:MAG: MtrB/PioB family decaheme-associated outer membrane protein [Ignavibacteria bacterium]